MKRNQHHVRLDEDVDADVKSISDATGLTQLEVIRQMVRAGARAIKENGYKLSLPLELRVIEQPKNSSSSTSGSGGGVVRKKMGDALGEAVQKKAAS